MAQPVRIYVCDDLGQNCCPVRFQADILPGNAIYINTDDVNEFVAAIHAADDDLEATDDEDG